MEQIELVIWMPKKELEFIREFGIKDVYDIEQIIYKGTILPSGHGKLIDADSLSEWVKGMECVEKCKEKSDLCKYGCHFVDEILGIILSKIHTEYAVVGADKEGAENERK